MSWGLGGRMGVSVQICMLSGSKYRKGFFMELHREHLQVQKPFAVKNWPPSQRAHAPCTVATLPSICCSQSLAYKFTMFSYMTGWHYSPVWDFLLACLATCHLLLPCPSFCEALSNHSLGKMNESWPLLGSYRLWSHLRCMVFMLV